LHVVAAKEVEGVTVLDVDAGVVVLAIGVGKCIDVVGLWSDEVFE
jgi:hypothetical protein